MARGVDTAHIARIAEIGRPSKDILRRCRVVDCVADKNWISIPNLKHTRCCKIRNALRKLLVVFPTFTFVIILTVEISCDIALVIAVQKNSVVGNKLLAIVFYIVANGCYLNTF